MPTPNTLQEVLRTLGQDATTDEKGVIRLSGDLGGTADSPAVNKIKGMELSGNLPNEGDLLAWIDGAWKAAPSIVTIPQISFGGVSDPNSISSLEEALQQLFPDATGSSRGVIRLAGDLSGSATSPVVNKIKGMEVSSEPPSDGDVLTWLDGAWKPEPPIADIPKASTSTFGKVRLSDGVTTAGDIGGTAGRLSVIKLQDYKLNLGGDENPVYQNQFLKWNGDSWVNSELPIADENNYGTFKLKGDVVKHSSSGQLRVAGIQTFPVHCPCEPYDGDVLTWIASDGYWAPTSMPLASDSKFGGIKLTADLGGTASQPEVVGWKYKQLGAEFANPQRYDIPIYNRSPINYSNPVFGFDLDEPEDDKWTLINLQEIIGNSSFTAGRDLSGTNSNQTVVGIYNIDIDPSAAEPAIGDVLVYKETFLPAFDLEPTAGKWVPTQLSPSDFFSPALDLSGGNFAQNVIGWRGKQLQTSFSNPADGDVPSYSSEEGKWNLLNLNAILGDLLNSYEPGNPEIKEYVQNGIRNKYYKYQESVQSVNTVRGTFTEYSVQDNSCVFISGKIIGRVLQNNELEAPPITYSIESGNPSNDDVNLTPSTPSIEKLGFDIDSPVYPGYTVVYDIEASYVKNDGYIVEMFTANENPYGALFSTGIVNNIVAKITEYPAGISNSFLKPVIQFVDNSTIQIATGYASTATINWTIDLEIRENGI